MLTSSDLTRLLRVLSPEDFNATLDFFKILLFRRQSLSKLVDAILHAFDLLNDTLGLSKAIQEVFHFDERNLLLLIFLCRVNLRLESLHLLIEVFFGELKCVWPKVHLALIKHLHELSPVLI